MRNTFFSFPTRSTLTGGRCFSFGRLGALADRNGQSLVELALVLPLFILILIGSAEVARFAWASIIASNAARAGAQYAAQNHVTADPSNTTGIGNAVAGESADLGDNLTWTSDISCACASGTSTASIACSNARTACPSPSTILVYVQVNTTATITPLIHYPGLPRTFTTHGQATLQVLE
jgi:Flp pilus assembly protein TadG